MSLEVLREHLKEDFVEYCTFAMDHQGKKISDEQKIFCRHLQSGKHTVAVAAARGCGKTVVGIHYLNWRQLRCPRIQIKCLTGRHEKAAEISQAVLRNLQSLPWLSHICPRQRKPRITQYWLGGITPEKEPSITAQCITSGGVTGSHVHLVYCDDIQPKMDKTEVVIDDLRKGCNEITNVLVDIENVPWMKPILTPDCPEYTQHVEMYTLHDLYHDLYTPPIDPNEPHFMRGAHVLTMPAIRRDDENGIEFPRMEGKWSTNFPNRISTAEMYRKCKSLPASEWALEYMLNKDLVPRSEYAVINMDVVSENAWTDKTQGVSSIAGWHYVIDPADKGGDYFIVVECAAFNRCLWIRDIQAYTRQSTEISIDKMLMTAKQQGKICKLHYEDSFQSTMTPLLKLKMAEHKLAFPINAIHSRQNKTVRIVQSLETNLNSGIIKLHKRVLERVDVRRQLEGLTYNCLPKPHDDIVDCMSIAYMSFQSSLGGIGKHTITNYKYA